jgi:type I restriction enzyme, R subunit
LSDKIATLTSRGKSCWPAAPSESSHTATEADTCRTHVLPALYGAGWADDQIAEQYFFTDGRLIVSGRGTRRGKRKFADYLLRFTPDLPLAVVEAKAEYKRAAAGQQLRLLTQESAGPGG